MNRLAVGIYSFFLALFGLIGYLAHLAFNFPGDSAVTIWLEELNLPLLKSIMPAVSYLSSLTPAVIIVVAVSAGLWVMHKKLEAIFIPTLTSLAALANWLLKWLINRPRPGAELMATAGGNSEFSFPSGHTVYAFVFYGLLFCLIPNLIKQPSVIKAIRAVSILLILLTGVSRVYLGTHWPSDILGSFLLGGLLLAPTLFLYDNYQQKHQLKPAEKNARITRS